MWESHADTGARRIVKPGPERALPVYTVDEPWCVLADWMVAAVTAPPVGTDNLEALLRLRRRRPSRYPQSWRVCCNVYCRECWHRRPLHHPRQGLQTWRPSGVLPGMPVPASRARPGSFRRDWATIVCFSCGKSGHGGRCPELNDTFPYMLPGWSAEKVGGNCMMISPRVKAERLRAGKGN